MNTIPNDTIIALATPSGVGAIAVIRLSGSTSIEIVNQFFRSKFAKKDLTNVKSHTIHLGNIIEDHRIIDEVLVSVFKNPNSYTGENVVEINCHGSVYIQQEIIQLFIKNGVRNAEPGEFTLRAFLNGKMDLSQAEAVADLISSNSAASHQVALQQMRGGFSSEIENLREQLLNFASLIELELDFAEEDVEFADRTAFNKLVAKISSVLKKLIDSFALGNVLKNGIPVAIIGEPNVGKSTLLNALLNEEKAIVSDIAGTTRDAIEDEISIDGIAYRFIDTAGIRNTKDIVESIGIKKTFEKIEQAQLVIYLFDLEKVKNGTTSIENIHLEINKIVEKHPTKHLMIIANKVDVIDTNLKSNVIEAFENMELLFLSAKEKTGIHELTTTLAHLVNKGALSNNETIVSNSRHFEALNNAYNSIKEVQKGIDANISTDLFAIDIRQALHYLGEITGKVTTEDLLGNIFANFCIGK
ncbi:tRNA uridine-5-carboxymethylaminomethyl(34) synthesis GTPase MnmE [Lutibacter sp. B1]|uniref:tRNA uridine-5-carboxymethylaminomethyl(34) synthesis GTPase MnmE n=1 Tax=Lutibacter sp. B1 TaxID=2725996 RepID=UPI001456D5FE|nr:tRNA uridine-5-carboxymethylaminomethyl(34) synthesis GTPase MnmE [Lutibacter sp. B1]NLP59161.1 tRNA uridine-5-carboxymethylaminomethyl(34) synthesis GTPase MnmE [Lutibacter sp. B1]